MIIMMHLCFKDTLIADIERDIQAYPVFMISKRNNQASRKAEKILRKYIYSNQDMKILEIGNHPYKTLINVSDFLSSS